MRIGINLASRPFADLGPALKRLRIAMGVLALAAIGLGIGLHLLGSKAEAARARERVLDSSITRLRQEQQGYRALMAQPDNSQVLDQAVALNKIFDEKAFSWTLAMEDLETVLPGGVQVTSLEPVRDKKDGHITLHLRVVGPRDKDVQFVENLEHSRRFLLPRISGESAESGANGTQRLEPVSASNRVNFDVLADYNPAMPGERKATRKKPSADNENRDEERTARPQARHAAPAANPAEAPATQAPGPGLRRPPYVDRPRSLPADPYPNANPNSNEGGQQ